MAGTRGGPEDDARMGGQSPDASVVRKCPELLEKKSPVLLADEGDSGLLCQWIAAHLLCLRSISGCSESS